MSACVSRNSFTFLSRALLTARSRRSTFIVQKLPSPLGGSGSGGSLIGSCHQRCWLSSRSFLRLRRPSDSEEHDEDEDGRQRPHAITLFPGDYGDEDDEDEFDHMEAWEEDADERLEVDLDETDEMAEILERQEEFERIMEARKIAVQRPPLYKSVIDRLGRAYGRGGRKSARARVWIQPGTGEVVINRKSFVDYFERQADRELILAPFVATETCGKFDMKVAVKGGGLTGQAGAIRHGLSNALNHYNPDLYRAPLKVLGFLTRDARTVERKKVGKLKARKSPQWVRR